MSVRLLGISVAAAAVLALGLANLPLRAVEKQAPQQGHMVYFKLKNSTDANRAKLVAACKKHLVNHEGTLYFAVGTIAPDFKRDVNVTDWDVALHLVFKNKAAHDLYHDHPRHLKFIEENKELWSGVKVFDSYIEADGESK